MAERIYVFPRTETIVEDDPKRRQMLQVFEDVINQDPALFGAVTFEVRASRVRSVPPDGVIFVVLKRKTRHGVTKDKLDVVMSYRTWKMLSDQAKLLLAEAVTKANGVPWVPNDPNAVIDIRDANAKIDQCYNTLSSKGIDKPLTMYSYHIHRRRFGEMVMDLTRIAFFYRTPNMRGGVKQCGATIYKRVLRGEAEYAGYIQAPAPAERRRISI